MYFEIRYIDSEFKVYQYEYEPAVISKGMFTNREDAVDLSMRLNEVLLNYKNYPFWIPTKPGEDQYYRIYFDHDDLTFSVTLNVYEGDYWLDCGVTLWFECFETEAEALKLIEELEKEL